MSPNEWVAFGVKAVPIKTDADGAGLVFETFAIALTGLVGRSVTGCMGSRR